MEINGITVPDSGVSVQYIPDPIGGWMYVVTTSVAVEQKNLQSFQTQLDDAKAKLAEDQAQVDELTTQAQNFEAAINAATVEPSPVDPVPVEVNTPIE